MLKNLIYILQIEGYDLKRFLKFAYTHHWFNLQQRKRLVLTLKSGLILSFIYLFLIVFLIIFFQNHFLENNFQNPLFYLFTLLLTVFIFLILPLIISLITLLLLPLEYFFKICFFAYIKQILINSKIITIGITGSYGKTSTKEILSTFLSTAYPTLKTPENINTDLGIAFFILKNQAKLKQNRYFVAEMGANQTGDIQRICSFIKPSYSLLTGINEAHLERFKNLKNTIQTKFELPKATSKMTFLNLDDKNIQRNYKKFNLKGKTRLISGKQIKNLIYKKNFAGFTFEWENQIYETNFLSKHNIALILLSLNLAQELKVPLKNTQTALKEIKPIPHRLEPIYNSNTQITVIDDSYNGNFNGIKSGILVLQRAKKGKVVLTPGLVELGQKSKAIHKKIAKLYIKYVDLVLLIQSPATLHIIKEFKKHHFTNYKLYASTSKAHNDLKNILQTGDTILFQNDLTDNYF